MKMIDNCGAAYRQKYQYCAGGLLMDLGHGNSISAGAGHSGGMQFLDLFGRASRALERWLI